MPGSLPFLNVSLQFHGNVFCGHEAQLVQPARCICEDVLCCFHVGEEEVRCLPNWYIFILSGSEWINGCVSIADVVKGQPASISYSLWQWTYFGKWRMVNFWQRKTVPLASLAVCTSSMFILFPVPFLGLQALSTKVFWFPFCLGWRGLISTQGTCWLWKGRSRVSVHDSEPGLCCLGSCAAHSEWPCFICRMWKRKAKRTKVAGKSFFFKLLK